jgi:hypothetical protein
VSLDHAAVISVLDAECAAAGITTVCVAARCEDSPRKGIPIADAAALAGVLEEFAPMLCCDWRIHARVELTDDGAVDALDAVLAASSRVALISMMETSIERSRFASLAETQAFYAQDWGVSEAEFAEVFTVDARQVSRIPDRGERSPSWPSDATSSWLPTTSTSREVDVLGQRAVLGLPTVGRALRTTWPGARARCTPCRGPAADRIPEAGAALRTGAAERGHMWERRCGATAGLASVETRWGHSH